MNILEVNNYDIYGKSFNGYDFAEKMTNDTDSIYQIVINKLSESDRVTTFFKNYSGIEHEEMLYGLENEILSVHSLLSVTSSFLYKNEYYKNADIVHYHMFHNTHLSLPEFLEMARHKPSILDFHDPWFLTGRCVHPGSCNKWQTGCEACECLDTLFPFTEDNCSEMWKIKKQVLENADIDVIVHSQYMLDLLKSSEYAKGLNYHLLPFGIDLKKYEFSISQKAARKALKIPEQGIVLFLRGQNPGKGTGYIVEALKNLSSDKKIILLSCSEKGLLSELEGKYEIIELGNCTEKTMLLCYNACDMLLMPSLGESFGMMAVEAMASGKPVVVFNNTALPHTTWAPDCGVLVNDRDSDDLREKIAFLIENPEEMKRRGELGRQIAREHYDEDKFHEQQREIYYKSYARQKYKLSVQPNEKIYKVDWNRPEIQELLGRLYLIYSTMFPNEKPMAIFSKWQKKDIVKVKIKFSDTQIQHVITDFNKELSKDFNTFISNKENSVRKRKFSQSWIYTQLKKIELLRKAVRIIRERWNNRRGDR